MEYEKIKQLMEDMGSSKLSSIDIDFPDGTKISIKKELTQEVKEQTNNIMKQENKTYIEKVEEKSKDKSTNEKIIKSPMVGTFYIKPSPTAEPYVEIGKTVKKGDTLCIIEAMKLMNEIESEYEGKIKEILVEDGEPVEYGKPLFTIE